MRLPTVCGDHALTVPVRADDPGAAIAYADPRRERLSGNWGRRGRLGSVCV